VLPGRGKERSQILKQSLSALGSLRIAQLEKNDRKYEGKEYQKTDVMLSPLKSECDFVPGCSKQNYCSAGEDRQSAVAHIPIRQQAEVRELLLLEGS
jgi:hypothetical protein